MIGTLVRRLIALPLLLLAISLITFTLGFYGPGDPVQQRLGVRANPEAAARLRAELGLDRSFAEQYVTYVGNALRGDLGESFPLFPGQPVGTLIARGLWVTVQLNLAALLVGGVVGMTVGIIAALFRNSPLDQLLMAGTVGAISFPSFVVGPILMWFFVARLRLVTIGWDGLFSTRAILPILVLSLGPMAVFARQSRASLADVLDAEYVRMARAKGLPETRVIIGHALRNALTPLLTIFGLMIGGLVSGAFITEQLFGIPGIGRLGVSAFFARDYPIIMALTLVIAAAYALTNLVVDLLYALIDPRVRYE